MIYQGTTRCVESEVSPRAKADDGRGDPQDMQRLKFRASILALDPHAELYVDRNPLKVTHSKCGGGSTQKAMNDISNFREHVSICQANVDNGSLKCSLRGRPDLSMHPTTPTPGRPEQHTCPGFGFKSMFGKEYNSLSDGERERITRAAKVAGLLLVNPGEKSTVISRSCLRTSPPGLEPAQPCNNCRKVVELSDFGYVLSPEARNPITLKYSPFLRQ